MWTFGQQAGPQSKVIPALLFRVEEREFAIPSARIDEIVPAATTLRMPGQPPVVEGFLAHRGESVPIVAFRRLFGFPAGQLHAYTPFVILRVGKARLGLLVDCVDEVVEMNSMSLQAIDEIDSLNGCAEARYTTGGHSVILLNCDRLLLLQETQRIAELSEQAQRRLDGLEVAPRE